MMSVMIFLNNRAMKKVLYSMMALFCFAIVSCEKEQNIDTPDTTPSEPFEFVLPANIPATLTASYTDTKTDYDADGKFSWTAGDQVALMYVNDLSKPTSQGWVAYEVTSTSNEGRYATFDIVKTADNQGRATAMADYKSTGIAIYPASVARPSSGTSEYVSYGKPFFTKPSSLTGSASEVMLIGSPANEENPTDLKFSTAMAVLKISVSGIPSDAVTFGLYTADQDNYPIAGDYLLNIGGDKEVKLGDYTKYGSFHTGQAYLKASLSGADTQTFYFNIPTGTYAANTISMKLLDANDNVLLEKTIKKEFTFNRNDLIEVGPYANEWVTLGTGKFIDNFLWAKISGVVGKDVLGYVDVDIQQNVTTPTKFRLVNPYGAAAAKFGYTSVNAAQADDYLEFEVSATTTGSAVTNYSTHRTGFAIDSGNYNPELVYPTTYNSGYDTSLDKVLVGDETIPKIVQFAPVYRYNGSTTAYNQATHGINKKGNFRIFFPGVTGYEGSLKPGSGATAGTLSPLAWTHESNAARIRMVISQYTDVEIAAPYVNSYYCGNYPSGNDAANSASNTNWNASAKVTAANMSSGPVYLSWFTTNADESIIYSQGHTKVYYLNADDQTALCKQHLTSGKKGSATDGDALSGSYTFEVGDDPLTGNIKMVEFDGMTSTGTSLESNTTHQIFSSLNWVAPGNTQYTGPERTYAPGIAQYGIYDSSTGVITLDATKPFFKIGNVNIYVYSYSDYAGSGRGAANTPGNFKFSVLSGKVDVADTYVNARFDGNDQASAPYANSIKEN